MKTLRGEYWIDDSGTVIFADGDAGVDVPNHAAYVRIRLMEDLIDTLDRLSRWGDLANLLKEQEMIDAPALREAVNNWVDCCDGFTDDEKDDIFAVMAADTEIDYSTIMLALGHGDADELRRHGCEMGWVRVLDECIDLHGLASQKLKQVAEGLYEIHDEAALTATFNIEDRATGRCFWGVPFHAIEAGSVAGLAEFRRILAG